ncbi:MAG: hypothetical protein WBL16_08390 [Zwartia sp.]
MERPEGWFYDPFSIRRLRDRSLTVMLNDMVRLDGSLSSKIHGNAAVHLRRRRGRLT